MATRRCPLDDLLMVTWSEGEITKDPLIRLARGVISRRSRSSSFPIATKPLGFDRALLSSVVGDGVCAASDVGDGICVNSDAGGGVWDAVGTVSAADVGGGVWDADFC